MRQCQCGGVVDQWPVRAGDAWRCRGCGRQQTQELAQDDAEPDGEREQDDLFQEAA